MIGAFYALSDFGAIVYKADDTMGTSGCRVFGYFTGVKDLFQDILDLTAVKDIRGSGTI